tara:strand:+ start:1623 stop:1961 length:339 start_codon:yes stop_codon:yes gene_type:complete
MSFKEKFNAKKALAESESFLPKGMQYQKEITITETRSPMASNGDDDRRILGAARKEDKKLGERTMTQAEYEQFKADADARRKRKIFEEKIKEEQELKDDPFAEELIMGSEGL